MGGAATGCIANKGDFMGGRVKWTTAVIVPWKRCVDRRGWTTGKAGESMTRARRT